MRKAVVLLLMFTVISVSGCSGKVDTTRMTVFRTQNFLGKIHPEYQGLEDVRNLAADDIGVTDSGLFRYYKVRRESFSEYLKSNDIVYPAKIEFDLTDIVVATWRDKDGKLHCSSIQKIQSAPMEIACSLLVSASP